jgi:Tol biopolymer transport system component
MTANEHVNWAPYWHPDGTRLVYASSEVGHSNYEIFSVEMGKVEDKDGEIDSPRRVRITQAQGADVLPVFDSTGRRMMWTSQRGAGRTSQLWIADLVSPAASSTTPATKKSP